MSEALRPLVEAAQAGDRDALNSLARCADRFVRLFSGSLSRQVRRAYGSTVDFVLEGMAEALSRLDEFEYRSDEEFYAWVTRLIRHRIVDAGRREGRDKRAGHPRGLQTDDGDAIAGDPSASRTVSAGEIRRVVADALLEQQVSHPEEMEVVLLKVFEGQSWPGIRGWLGLTSEKRARTLFVRGLDLLRPRIRDALGRDGFEEFLGVGP